MRDYRHMMEQVTLSDQAKEEIMNVIENKKTGRRRVPRAAKIALAAVLVAGCVLSIAAGLPARVYSFISGGSLTINPGTDTAYYDRLNAADPVEVDGEGRVWLTADGQHLDITDKADENTPYIYERTDGATGQKGYLVVGGSHDNLGWMEWYQVDGDWFWHAENCLNGSSSYSVGAVGGAEGSIVVEVPDEPGDSADADGAAPYQMDFRPWVEAAIEQLAEMGIVQCDPQVD